MQDFKHLTSKKRFSGFGFFRATTSSTGNRRISAKDERFPGYLRPPKGKRLERLKHLLVFFAVVLALTPVCMYVFNQAPRAAVSLTHWMKTFLPTSPTAAEAARNPAISTFGIASRLLDSATLEGEQLVARTPAGDTLHYTIQNSLQQRIHDFMADYKVPYGVVVAIEPATGRILAMTSYSSIDPEWSQNSFFDLYPMASLFKIVTASAALENGKMNPDTVIEFRGNSYSENPRYWEVSPRGKNNRMDVSNAMGKSINPVYGRVAADIAGKAFVLESIHKFGFNQSLLPGTPAKESQAAEPLSTHGLMRMGAGLDHDVKISPLHAAVMMAAIANGGKMMSPGLTDKVLNSGGTAKETHIPREIRQLVSPETASSLTRMLTSTVTNGTSRKAFHDRRGRPLLEVDIAAKTGSINGTDPRGHYSWFAAFAPVDNPQIALAALVINQDKWKIKSSQVGERALQEFFDRQGTP